MSKDSAFEFGGAPSKNYSRQLAVAAGALGFRGGRGKSTNSKGHSARDTSNLMAQEHAQNLEMQERQTQSGVLGAAASHVIGQEAARGKARIDRSASRQTHKQGLEKAAQETENKKGLSTHHSDLIHNLSTNERVSGGNLSSGAFSFTAPSKSKQFDTDKGSAVNLD